MDDTPDISGYRFMKHLTIKIVDFPKCWQGHKLDFKKI